MPATDSKTNETQTESIKSINLNLLEALTNESDEIVDKYMTFTLNDRVYGIEIQNVREIVDMQKITNVPGMEDYIKGLINLRGQVIPVLDVRLRFGMKFREYNPRTCIIVVEFHETMIGLIVDRVADVLIIPRDQIQEPPSKKDQGYDRFIKGLDKSDQTVKLILDTEKLISRAQ
ncbi:MAG: purine-binding chemotaxis protein CheW [SAR324 cluster bacterium]|nr:purine-binding chemotaxis protein CheW [SAR324 cluster bacterium]